MRASWRHAPSFPLEQQKFLLVQRRRTVSDSSHSKSSQIQGANWTFLEYENSPFSILGCLVRGHVCFVFHSSASKNVWLVSLWWTCLHNSTTDVNVVRWDDMMYFRGCWSSRNWCVCRFSMFLYFAKNVLGFKLGERLGTQHIMLLSSKMTFSFEIRIFGMFGMELAFRIFEFWCRFNIFSKVKSWIICLTLRPRPGVCIVLSQTRLSDVAHTRQKRLSGNNVPPYSEMHRNKKSAWLVQYILVNSPPSYAHKPWLTHSLALSVSHDLRIQKTGNVFCLSYKTLNTRGSSNSTSLSKSGRQEIPMKLHDLGVLKLQQNIFFLQIDYYETEQSDKTFRNTSRFTHGLLKSFSTKKPLLWIIPMNPTPPKCKILVCSDVWAW